MFGDLLYHTAPVGFSTSALLLLVPIDHAPYSYLTYNNYCWIPVIYPDGLSTNSGFPSPCQPLVDNIHHPAYKQPAILEQTGPESGLLHNTEASSLKTGSQED